MIVSSFNVRSNNLNASAKCHCPSTILFLFYSADLSSNVQIISGNIGKIQIGPTNISVAEARNVTMGDKIKISTDGT